MRHIALLTAAALAISSLSQTAVAEGIKGTVIVGGKPVPGATVTLWRTAGKKAPKSLAKVSTGSRGDFKIRDSILLKVREYRARAQGDVFYLTTEGGTLNTL